MIKKGLQGLWQRFKHESLFRNSIYLILSTAILGATGFIFWAISSHLYSPSEIGIATSLISISSFILAFSNFGFSNVITRFLSSSKDKSAQLSTVLSITSIATIILTGIFLFWAKLTNNPIVSYSHFSLLVAVFITYCLVLNINNIEDNAFTAYRNARYSFIKNTIIGLLKVGLLFLLIGFGSRGILGVITLATLISLIIGIFILIKKFDFSFSGKIDRSVINETKHFAFSNYIGNLFGILPASLVPIIILSRIGAAQAAFFYIPASIVTLLNIIPSAISQSLLAETAHDESKLEKNIITATRDLFLILIPAVVLVWLLGGVVLKFFGSQYTTQGLWPLKIMSLTSIVGALNYFGDTLLNIKKNTVMYIVMNALNAILIVTFVYIAAPSGLIKITLAMLLGQFITVITYLILNWRLVYRLR